MLDTIPSLPVEIDEPPAYDTETKDDIQNIKQFMTQHNLNLKQIEFWYPVLWEMEEQKEFDE